MTMNKTFTHRLSAVALGLSALWLTACSTAPVRPAEPAPPARWQQADASAQAGDSAALPRWEALGDTGLAALQQRVLAANLDLKQSALRLQSSATALGLKDLRLNPSLGGSYSGSRPLQSSGPSYVNVGGQQVPIPSNDRYSASWGLSTGLSWELDLWGRIAAERSAQQADHEALKADAEGARTALLSRTAELWWQLGALQARLPLAQAQVAHAEEALPLVKARVQEGKLLPVELDRASRRLLEARHRLADIQADQQLRLQDLGLLLDEPRLDQVSSLVRQARLPSDSQQAWSQQAVQAPAEVLARRPDVQRARLQVDAALARLKVAQASRYPTLSLSAGVGSSAQSLGKLLKNPVGSVSSSLAVPLIDWRRLNLQEDIQHTELEISALQLRDTLAKAMVDVETRWVETARLERQAQAQQAALQDAIANEAQAKVRMEVGALGRAEWLQTQDALLEARQQQIQLQLNRWLNQSAFIKAVGGAR